MTHVRDQRIDERALQNGVEIIATHSVAIRLRRDTRLEVVVGSPREHFESQRFAADLPNSVEDLDGFGGDVLADTISGNHGDTHNQEIIIQQVGTTGTSGNDANT